MTQPCTRQENRRRAQVRRWFGTVVLAAIACFHPGSSVWAHPDIEIESRVTFIFQGQSVSGIEEAWTFDPDYSETLLADYGADRHGSLSAAQSRAIAERTLPNLAEVRYFTYARVDGRDLGTLPLRDFVATLGAGRVTFSFILDLPAPVDPRHQALKVEIDDPDYYAAFRLSRKDPIRLRDSHGIVCEPRVRDDVENAYFGYVYPQEITLSCR